MRLPRISHIILSLAALFAVLVLFATYGTTLAGVPFASIGLNGPVAADSNGEFTTVADTESRRVLILNSDGDLTGLVDCETMDSPITYVNDVCVVGEDIYVAGVRTTSESNSIEKERIAVFDKGGNLKGTVYEVDGAGDDTPSIKSIDEAEDGIVFVRMTKTSPGKNVFTGTGISFVFANGAGSRELQTTNADEFFPYDTTTSADMSTYATLSTQGQIARNGSMIPAPSNHIFTAIDIDSRGRIIVCDNTLGAVCTVSDDGAVTELIKQEACDSVHTNQGLICTCNRTADTVTICNEEGKVESSFSAVVPSFGYSARMMLVWAAALYLIVLVLVLAIRGIYRRISSGDTEGFGPALASLAIISVVIVAVLTLSYSSYEKSLSTRVSEIGMWADYLAFNAVDYSKEAEDCDNRELLRINGDDDSSSTTSSFVSMGIMLSSIVSSAKANDIGMYYVWYGKDDKGIFYILDSSWEYVTGSSVTDSVSSEGVLRAFAGEIVGSEGLSTGRTRYDATLYRLVRIPTSDGSGTAGVIEIGSSIRSFESGIMTDLGQRVLGLLVILLVVYLTYSELRASGRCMLSYRAMRVERQRDAIAVLTRPFTFAITLISSIDSVMTVLIARDMLDAAGQGTASPLLAVPPIMLGVGLMIGQGLYGLTSARVGLRRLVTMGAICMLVFAVGTAFVVSSGIFWLYCVAKLFMAIPFGLLYALGYSLPRLAKDDGVRSLAAGGVKRTDTSAAALGTVLGAYVAQILGNAWVYALVALACVPVIIMAVSLLPRKAKPLESNTSTTARRSALRFVRSPLAVAIALLILLPATIAAGYTSFLFPLFSADLGLTKTEINNIFVLGQLVVFICINRIDALEDRHGKWRVSICALAILGAVFLLFAIRTTLVWSIAVIALVGVLGKSTDGWKAMWLYSADMAGVPAGRATGAMFAARSAALIAQPFILGALLGVVSSVAVVVIGAICVLAAGLFFLTTRHSMLPAMK